MDTMTWLAVGMLGGMLVSIVLGEDSVLRDIVLGLIGISVGAWLFRALGIQPPFAGLPGTVFTTFVGAVLLRLLWGVARVVRVTWLGL